MNQKGAEMLDTNMSGRNPREIVAEFQFGRLLNSNVKSIVFHASMSAAPGEELSNDTWKDFARDYLEGMGFDDNQYIVVRHHEPEDEGKHDHAHVHIVASRVKLTGECVSASWDYIRSNNLMKELEQKYDLVPTPHHLSNQKEQHNPTKGEMRLLYQQQQEFDEGKRTEPPQPSARMKLQALIDELTQQPTTMTNLIDQLQSTGVEVRIKQTRNNIIQGISFAHPDWEHGFKGSDLGKHYSWAGLQTHKSVSYDPVRDAEAIANSATNSRASTNKKIAAKQLQPEVADGIAGTVTAESQTASSKISDTSATARSNRGVEVCDRTTEPAVNQPPAADIQSDSGKKLVETAVNQLDRNTEQLTTAVSRFTQSADDVSRRLEQTNINSRKRTEQSERQLATAPSGAGSKSRAAASSQIDITKELDQLESAVHEVNSELELQLGGNQSTSKSTRTASRTASAEQSRTDTTTKISEANVQQQSEEINRIHDGIRRRRREKLQQFELDLAAGNNQSESKNEPSRAAVKEPEFTKELAKTIDDLGKLHQYISAGITRFNAEFTGKTQQYRVEIGYPGEQSEERQTMGVYSLEDAQRGNSDKHQATEHIQQKDRAVGNPETGTVWVGDVSRNQYHCTKMFASNIDTYLLRDTDKYDDDYFTAERVSPTEISLCSSSDQREILRARYIGGENEDWQALPCEREMTYNELHSLNALTENIIKQLESEYCEQQEFVNTLAPSIATLLDIKETTRLVGERYIAEWSEPFLTIEEIGNPKLIMKAERNDERELWFEAGSNLTDEITDHLSEKAELLIEKATQQEPVQQYIPPPIREQRQLEM